MSIETTQIVNIALGLLGLVIGLMALVTSQMLAGRTSREWNAFAKWRRIWILNMFAMGMDVISNASAGRTSSLCIAAKHTVEFTAFLVNLAMLVWFAEALIDSIGIRRKDSRWLRFCHLVSIPYSVLLVISLKTKWLYFIDAMNVYHRGEYFYIMWVICALIEFGNIILILSSKKKLDRLEYLSYLLMGISTTAATLIQMFSYGISLIYMSIAIAILVIYVLTQHDLYERLYRQERELSENRMQSMISMLQPHFLYNALTAIMAIEGTPEKTQNAIRDFAGYLRGNMDSLNDLQLIPFEQELKHIRTYLNLEKLRFGEKLTVVTSIECTNFLVPPLCIQMLVENAIKHGIHPKEGPGTVTLKVREKMGYYEICILDDGVGFDPHQKLTEERSHVGMMNSEYRLKELLHATMTIESEVGRGTKIVIQIPMEESICI